MPVWKSLLLYAYYYASCPARWWSQRGLMLRGRAPVTVLFYHRVADDGATPWTCSHRVFARQVDWLADRFDMISMAEAQRRIRAGDNPRPAVHLTFDDGYSENCRQAVPLLVKLRIPCTYFVTVGNVLTGEPFPHDAALGHRFPPNTPEQLRAMAAAGIEIGAHTYSHADLGEGSDADLLRREIVDAGRELRALVGRPVRYFAFPFGQYVNLTSAAFDLARQSGYEAACSAYGGYNLPGGDPFHIQRIHADGDMIRVKNHATFDPRKRDVPPFVCTPPAAADAVP